MEHKKQNRKCGTWQKQVYLMRQERRWVLLWDPPPPPHSHRPTEFPGSHAAARRVQDVLPPHTHTHTLVDKAATDFAFCDRVRDGTVFRPALGPIPPSVQWVKRVRRPKNGAVPPLTHTSSLSGAQIQRQGPVAGGTSWPVKGLSASQGLFHWVSEPVHKNV